MLELGFLQEVETLENRDPTQRRAHSHPQLLLFVTAPDNYQVAGKDPFLCQRSVISLREINEFLQVSQLQMKSEPSLITW